MTRPRRRRWLGAAVAAWAAVALLAPPLSATIEEQRQRLPPPATCQDPAEGIWMALKYQPRWGEWENFILEIHRDKPGEPGITGNIKNHFWYAGGNDPTPPACGKARDYIVRMEATGTEKGGTIQFDGRNPWKNDPTSCRPFLGRYNPDHFSGTIEVERQEFQSVNNDGGRAVNDPYVFRRVKCFDTPPVDESKPPPSGISVKPPSFMPKAKSMGCSL